MGMDTWSSRCIPLPPSRMAVAIRFGLLLCVLARGAPAAADANERHGGSGFKHGLSSHEGLEETFRLVSGLEPAAAADAVRDSAAAEGLAPEVAELTEVQIMNKAMDLQKSLRGLENVLKQQDHDAAWYSEVYGVVNLTLSRSNGLLEQLSDKDCYQYPSHRRGNPASGKELGRHMFGWTPVKCWTSLWHPYLWLYMTHLVVALTTTVLAFFQPKVLICVMAASGLLWPISGIIYLCGGGGNIWYTEPWSGEWVMTFVKWLIVDAAAALPVLIVKDRDLDANTVERVGEFIYCILGANILWTLIYKVNGWVRFVNFNVGIVLTLSLALEVIALKKARKPLLEKINGIPYGRATPMLWLVCYTVWNAIFVGDLSIGITLQDILFWAMMYMMQYVDSEPLTIDNYFAFARPLQLGVYIALGCWTGIIPWFRDAEDYFPVERLGINDDFFFLFVTALNLILSFVVLAGSILDVMHGPKSKKPLRTMSMAESGIALRAFRISNARAESDSAGRLPTADSAVRAMQQEQQSTSAAPQDPHEY